MARLAGDHIIAVFNDDDIEDDDTDTLITEDVVDGDYDDPDREDSDTDSDDANTNSTIPTTATPALRPSITSSSSAAASFTVSIPAGAVSNGGASAPLYDGITVTTCNRSTITTPTPVTPDLKQQRFDDRLIMTEKKPVVEDSRRLFQRLWTDEDEIELLRGFLEYTAQRSTTSSGHQHHDTAAFYDQIKSKLQLDCNKNQLVEKLRRLKKKYRNMVNRINSGKEFVFKSPHNQATFEISRKIWRDSAVHRQELEDDDQQNPNPSCLTDNSLPNLNHADQNFNHIADNQMTVMTTTTASHTNASTPPAINKSRKRSRVKMEENLNLNQNENQTIATVRNANFGGYEAVVNVNSMQGLIDETVRNCLLPLLKEVVHDSANGLGGVGVVGPASGGGTAGGGGAKGIESLAMNAMPLNSSGLILGSGGELVDERWRRQQMLELEVYSKRLELVQDQIKSSLEELKV